jgi:hypothetical protein
MYILAILYTSTVFHQNKYNYLQKHKLFTDEFHYLKWIMKCTEIVYIMVSYIQSEKIDTHLTSLWRHARYLFFRILWNFARDISTVFEEIKHLGSRAPGKFFFSRLLKWIKHKYCFKIPRNTEKNNAHDVTMTSNTYRFCWKQVLTSKVWCRL